MARRKISKASKRRLTLFGTLSLVAIVYFGFSLLYNAYTVYTLNLEKKALETKYASLQEKAEDLKKDIDKFSDSNYLANYARENYLYSKEGEYIIQLDNIKDTEEELDLLSTLINKNYVVVALSIVMLLIFIYIFTKGRKKLKK